ncbi:MAG: YidB family protein [Burkholderiales bacterium]
MGILDDLLASAAGAQGTGGQSMGNAREESLRPMSAGPGGGGSNQMLMALLPVILSMLASRSGGAPAPQSGGGGLGDILGQVLGGGASQRGGGMGDILGQILGGGSGVSGAQEGSGGLGNLIEGFQRAGYGEHARSWVGTGQNAAITPEAIEQVFGRGGLEAIARQAGVSEADAARGLSQLLPEVVDRVTPNGDVPDLDALVASVDEMSRRYRSG